MAGDGWEPMKKAILESFGEPGKVIRCVEAPDPGPPAPDEIAFDVLAHPINPADLNLLMGRNPIHPPLPLTPGAECVGRVTAAGTAVSDLKPGDRIINMQRENWVQKRRVKAIDAIKVRDDIPVAQAAMLRINPPTALLLLEDVVALKAGDWVIQNGANSAVGKILIGLARDKGLRTINVVRRIALAPMLKEWGADRVVEDGPDLAARIAAASGGEKVRYAIDCVGGDAVRRLADAVADGGTVCNYGGLSGEDCRISPHALIYRGLNLTGFLLGRFLARRDRAQIVAIYDRLAERIKQGKIDVPVEKVYPIEQIADAVAHAAAYNRAGKILVAPNGPIG